MKRFDGRERRKPIRVHKRVGVNIISCNRRRTLPKLDEEVGIDISIGGMMIECSRKLAPGTALRLKIMLPHNSGFRIIETRAGVVWNKRSYRSTYYLGCKFSRLTAADEKAIVGFIKRNLP